jgi:hypothetical protein
VDVHCVVMARPRHRGEDVWRRSRRRRGRTDIGGSFSRPATGSRRPSAPMSAPDIVECRRLRPMSTGLGADVTRRRFELVRREARDWPMRPPRGCRVPGGQNSGLWRHSCANFCHTEVRQCLKIRRWKSARLQPGGAPKSSTKNRPRFVPTPTRSCAPRAGHGSLRTRFPTARFAGTMRRRRRCGRLSCSTTVARAAATCGLVRTRTRTRSQSPRERTRRHAGAVAWPAGVPIY